MTSVVLESVTKVFSGGTVAVDNVDMTVGAGEFVALLGPSGCGKSTLLRIVAGLLPPTSGRVYLGGRPVDDVPPRERGVAMVFQDYALYPHMTVGENIGFPLKLAGLDPDAQDEQTRHAAGALGIGHLLQRRPRLLSGGQRQRVAMGRAVVREPGLLLLDEPLSNLDAGMRSELRAEISGLTRQLGASTLYVTHDQTEALTMADKIAILRHGRLQDIGTPTEVYNRPATMYVATFLGNPRMSLLEAVVDTYHDSHVMLGVGEQALRLPWTHSQTRLISRYHGEKIVVGMRAEALTPVASGTPGEVLTGHIRTLEHHGHETLAFIDVGATAVVADEPPPVPPRTPSAGWRKAVGSFMARLNDDGSAVATMQPQGNTGGSGGRHHRVPAEVALRLAPYPHIKPGDTLAVAIDLEALHFFDSRGVRIDGGWR